jgi:hypothetical protein
LSAVWFPLQRRIYLKMRVFWDVGPCNIPEDCHLHIRRCENPKSQRSRPALDPPPSNISVQLLPGAFMPE